MYSCCAVVVIARSDASAERSNAHAPARRGSVRMGVAVSAFQMITNDSSPAPAPASASASACCAPASAVTMYARSALTTQHEIALLCPRSCVCVCVSAS